MNALEAEQLRAEIDRLIELGFDAQREGQFIAMEQLMEQADATAEQLGELKRLVWTRFWLAHSRRRQDQYQRALPDFLWLISIATDPASQEMVADDYSRRLLASSFVGFLKCARQSPGMPTAQLLRVVDDGLAWIESIGKPEWAPSLRLERGYLLWGQADLEGARREMETALALKRRCHSAPGAYLSDHLSALSDLLSVVKVGAYAEALLLAEEILENPTPEIDVRREAYLVLADAYSGLGRHEEALEAAQAALALAWAMESPLRLSGVYHVLSRIHRNAGNGDQAADFAAHGLWWRSLHAGTTQVLPYVFLAGPALIRLLQARQAVGLHIKGDYLPATLPPDANRSLALRRLDSARRFISRARVCGTLFDKASGVRARQDRLDELEQEADAIAALLASKENERG
ncbi:MAG: hypothetical protein ACR2M0_11945 [Chloroflexia bacterium]